MAAATMVTSRTSMAEACQNIGRVICEELQWDFLGIWTLESGTWHLRCTDFWCRPGGELTSFVRGVQAAALVPGVGLPGRAWAKRSVQWLTEDEIEGEPPPAHRQHTILPPSAIAAGLHGGLALPVRWGEDVLAVIEILGFTEHPPDQALAELLGAIGVLGASTELRGRAELRSELAEKELEEARERLEAVMDCAPANIATIACDDTVLFLNRPWLYLNNQPIVGASWKTQVEPTQQGPMTAALKKVFETGDHQSFHVAVKGSEDRPRWLANHIGPMRLGGRVAAAVVISQDVTDAKLAEAELADAQRLASVGTLAAGVAHEINTPVQFVSDSVHFIREAVTDVLSLVDRLETIQRLVLNETPFSEIVAAARAGSEALEAVDIEYLRDNMPKALTRVLDGLTRVATIVGSMKEFAHPAQREMAPVDLNRAIQSTLVVATSEYKYVADLETDFADLPPVVCHVNDINQAVLNIVVNAAHAIADAAKGGGRRGLITVKTEHSGRHVVISIGDNGGGIPERIQSRIYDPFFTSKEVGRGTGQGLAIARAIVEDKHGGELAFKTSPGVGTTFSIRLPIEGHPTTAG
jgi:signal transduction histidine kinase